MMRSILTVVRMLHRYAGSKLWLGMAGMVIVGLFSGFGSLLWILVLNVSGVMDLQFDVPLADRVEFAFRQLPPAAGIGLLLSGIVAASVLQHALQRTVAIRNVMLMQGFGQRMRHELYESLLQARWEFHLQRRRTDLINAVTVDSARLLHGTNVLLQFGASLVFTAIQIGIAFWISFEMTAFVMICGGLLALFSRNMLRKAKALGSRSSELAQTYLAEVSDQLNGLKEIKVNDLEERKLGWHRTLIGRSMKEQVEYIRLTTRTEFMYKTASAAFAAAFIFAAAALFEAKLDQLFIVLAFFARLWPRFTGLQTHMQQIASAVPSLQAVLRLREESREAAEPVRAAIAHVGGQASEIRCNQVSFRYETNGARYALKDVSLRIPANGLTAIVGRSGAGKSTLVDVIMGLIQPESGTVAYDGKPLEQIDWKALRGRIGYVPQEPYIFNGTIRENLLLTNPRATEEDMRRALRFASAEEFVDKLPAGLDTVAGDRGVRLSGGERQRLVLARAILKNPSILILDEATSALDAENEKKIQDALERMRGSMTMIVIAHRLSTIRNADHVIVLEDGAVVQTGSFQELAQDRNGLFGALLGYQMKAAL